MSVSAETEGKPKGNLLPSAETETMPKEAICQLSAPKPKPKPNFGRSLIARPSPDLLTSIKHMKQKNRLHNKFTWSVLDDFYADSLSMTLRLYPCVRT